MDLDTADLTRRELLKIGGVAGAGAGVTGGAWYATSDGTAVSTSELGEEGARLLAETYAPTLYFGEHERWFPTDPRPYTIETDDGDVVVDGFDAFDGYSAAFSEQGSPPAPTSFYHAVGYENASLAVVQFWFYSAFDQFSANFHWHDWEVLHVFVDTEGSALDPDTEADPSDEGAGAGEPVLFVASAHSRKVPNNEHLDPDTDRASVIPEVGSHSSALAVNEDRDSFQRYPGQDLVADVTNRAVALTKGAVSAPLAYGLPRDEGLRLPFVMPELDGTPIHEHENLPNVTREHLVPPEVTVRDREALSEPPSDLPTRRTGLTFVAAAGAAASVDADHEYDLVHVDEIRHIDDFTGPQLSFEFPVPTFAEDAVAGHITTTGVPWDQPRFEDPAADVSDPAHMGELASRYDPLEAGTLGSIVGLTREVGAHEDAPDGNGTALFDPTVEATAYLESEPTELPTWGGVVAAQDVPGGEHRLTVDGPGYAPYGEELVVDEGANDPARAGAGGEIALVAKTDATKINGDGEGSLANVTFEDDFGGPVFDGRPPGSEEGRFGLYVHREGALTADVEDEAGQPGAVRVNPNPDDESVTAEITTGKAPMVTYLGTTITETRLQTDAIFQGEDPRGIPTGTEVTDEVVDRAAENAADNVEGGGNDDGTTTDTADGNNALGGEVLGAAGSTGMLAALSPAVLEWLLDGDRARSGGETETTTGTVDPTMVDPQQGEGGVLRALDAAVLTAKRARDDARAGDPSKADDRLQRLSDRLDTLADVVADSDLPDAAGPMVQHRIDRLRPRLQRAIEADTS